MPERIQKTFRFSIKHILFICLAMAFSTISLAQSEIIGIIDFYGLNKVTQKELLYAIDIREGNKINYLGKKSQIKKLKSVQGVKQADITFVCCEEKGQSIVYIGISEKEEFSPPYHASPTSKINLPAEIIKTCNEFDKVFVEGIEKGESGEDRSQGHSFMNYAPGQAIQQKFVIYASEYLPVLKDVLKNSKDGEQRAKAAQVIAYAKYKNQVVDDLLYAVYDNNEAVRNNATRALALIAAYCEKNPELKIKKIPADPFIKMINSVVWTDRNKGVAVLLSLTENRDSTVLNQLKKQALSSVIEMSYWKNSGHAMMGYLLLGRMTGFSDEEIYNAFGSEKKNLFLDEMVKKLKEN